MGAYYLNVLKLNGIDKTTEIVRNHEKIIGFESLIKNIRIEMGLNAIND